MVNALRAIAAACGALWIMMLDGVCRLRGAACSSAHRRCRRGARRGRRSGGRQFCAPPGMQPAGRPAWAGAAPVWQAPGDYRVFFAATGAAAADSASPQDGTDIYAADLRIDGVVQVANQPQVRRLTDTPAGDETAPILVGDWLAFATRVGGRDPVCDRRMSLADLDQRKLFMFRDPPQQVALRWRAAWRICRPWWWRRDEAGSDAAFAVDLASGAVEPPAGQSGLCARRARRTGLAAEPGQPRPRAALRRAREDRLPGKRLLHPDRPGDPGCASIDRVGAGCLVGDGIWQPSASLSPAPGKSLPTSRQGDRGHTDVAACPCDHRYACRDGNANAIRRQQRQD